MQKLDKTNSSRQTVLAMFNSMVGGAMLTFPILYRSAGVVTSSIMLLLSGLISFVTCRIYVLHMSDSDRDVEWTIRRILGRKWQRFFRLITGFYLILLCVIYIDLIVDQLYSIIFFFFDRNGRTDLIALKDECVFDTFSEQWLTLIIFLPMMGMVFIKNLNLMVKLSGYGAYSAVLYFVFVVYKFIETAADGKIDTDKINWVTADVGNLAGTCALAFTIHTMVVTFVKPNRNQENNVRDVGFAYLLGFLLYESIGVLGAFAVQGRECKQTLVNCYLTEISILVVESSYLFGRITVFPCTLQVGRTRLIELFYEKVEDRTFRNFNIGFMVVASIFSILSPYLPITLMMNLVGALVSYFFIYVIPSAIHYRCLYGRRKEKKGSLMETITSEDGGESETADSVCRHDEDYRKSKPALMRFALYGVINLIGIAIGIYGLYTFALSLTG